MTQTEGQRQAGARTPVEVAMAAFDAVKRHDPDGVVAYSAEDCVDDFVAVGVFRGRAEIRDFFEELFAAVPDMEMTVDRLVSDDESAVVQWHVAGTFSGEPFQGIRATGRRIELKGVDVMEISDGLLRRNTIYYDGAAFARQAGLLPPQGSAVDRAMIAAFNAKTRLARRK